jgi:hypothetical protein
VLGSEASDFVADCPDGEEDLYPRIERLIAELVR